MVDNIHHMLDPLVTVKVVLEVDLPNSAARTFRWVVNEFQPPRNPPE
jgi:hypothetical protein